TIKVALSRLNMATPAAQIAPGSVLAGLRGGTFTTAGSGATGNNKADTARGGTQYTVTIGPLTPCGPWTPTATPAGTPSPTATTTPTATPAATPTGTPTPTTTPSQVSISGTVVYCT